MPYPATPKTWVSGDVLTAAQMNAELRDALLGAFPLGPPDVAWTAWTPTLANLTLGNGTRTAVYYRVGRLIVYSFKLVLGSTSAMGTAPTFTLPVAPAVTPYGVFFPLGYANYYDNATNNYPGVVILSSGSIVAFKVTNSAGTYVTTTDITATVPFTWVSTDEIHAAGFYQAAT